MHVFYFAYGSCMDEQDFRRTVPEFKVIGGAVLKDYKLAFTLFGESRNGGVADIVYHPGAKVEGVLYSMPITYLPQLDSREGVDKGMYERFEVEVKHGSQLIQAYTYQVVKKAKKEIKPSEYYVSLIMNGLKAHGSTKYIENVQHKLKKDFNMDVKNSELIQSGNRRKYERVPLNIPIKITVHQWSNEPQQKNPHYEEAILDDLSGGGIKIKSRVELKRDDFIRIFLPDHFGFQPIIGRVLRVEEGKNHNVYGCMVTGMTLHEQQKVEQYIRTKTG